MIFIVALISLVSITTQVVSIILFRNLFHNYQKEWLGNVILIFGFTVIAVHHLHSFLNSYNSTSMPADALFMLANSLIFYAIILCIHLVIKRIDYKNKTLMHKLKYDPLTRALSREVILSKCERELARAIRTGDPVALLTIDMDHFKEINDAYGHPIGDEVLIRSTNYCKELLREIDLIGRIGGDEFIVLLPNTDIDSAKEVAERLQGKMKNLINELSIRASKPISLSIGIACYDAQQPGLAKYSANPKSLLKQLISLSDEALYEAKRSGRCQCVITSNYEQVLRTG